MKHFQGTLITPIIFSVALLFLVLFFGINSKKVNAACAVQPTDLGSSTVTINVPVASSYRVWSRIKAPDSTNNSYLLEVDGGSCITVGDSAIATNTWTWVDYQSGNSATKTNLTLSSGNHTFKMIGREPDVSLDLVILTADTACVPTGVGTNCSNPADTTQPLVSLTAPANNATISGTVLLSASASDDVAVTKVEFRVDGTIVNTDTTSPYSYNWNSTSVSDGSHGISATAYDAAPNNKTSTVIPVTVSQAPPNPLKNGDVNGDNSVNIFDLSILATNWGGTSKTRAQGDLNNDAVVNVFDLSILAANWGT